MMKFFKGLLVLVLLALLAAAGLGWYVLMHRLTPLVRQQVLPRVLEEHGLDVELEHVALDLFSGELTLEGVAVKNPGGFAEPDLLTVGRVRVQVLWKDLLGNRDLITVQRLRIENLHLKAAWNPAGRINLQQLAEELEAVRPHRMVQTTSLRSTGGSMADYADGVQAVPAEPAVAEAKPKLLIKALEVGGVLEFRDEKVERMVPVRFPFTLRARNLASEGVKAPWADLYLTGTVEMEGQSLSVRANALAAPFGPPERLSFDLNGSVEGISQAFLEAVLKERLPIRTGAADVQVALKVREGRFESGSKLTAELREVVLPVELTGIGNMTVSRLTLDLPVKNTLMQPQVLWRETLQQAVMKNFKTVAGDVGRGLLQDALKKGDLKAEDAVTGLLGNLLGVELGEKKQKVTGTVPQTVPGTPDVQPETPEPEVREDEPEPAEPEKELSDREKAARGIFSVLEEAGRQEGRPVEKGIEETLKILLKK